jgi:hypothetical protein
VRVLLVLGLAGWVLCTSCGNSTVQIDRFFLCGEWSQQRGDLTDLSGHRPFFRLVLALALGALAVINARASGVCILVVESGEA